ncbi:MAG: binding domain protein [Planctomycetaceae bacterium]|nr:binding domain protein [Planctomycetaceae bacterium]
MSSDPTPDVAPISTEVLPNSVPEAENPAPPPPETTATEVTASEQPTAERPKVRLNPTVDPEQDKPVPYTSATAQEADKLTAELAAEDAATGPDRHFAPPATANRKVDPIEIPSKRDVSLDDEMEREIAEALASGDIPGAIATPTIAATASNSTPDAPVDEEDLEPGTPLKGKVQAIAGENVILDVGMRSSGCIPSKQFEGKFPEVGATVDVVVDSYSAAEGLVMCSLPKAMRSVSGWSEVQVGQIVDCMVTKTNKGGLEVTVNALRAFLPAGQVDYGFIANLDSYVGQKLRVKVTEVNPAKKNLVVSRRAFMEIERGEKRDEMWKTVAVGQTHVGVVKTIKEYGAFIDLGGLDGLLHVGEISWQRINHPSDILKEGQQVEVQIVGIDREKNKISLGMRQLTKNPWSDIEARYPVGSEVTGTVTRTSDFGAFVQLEEGIEGLIHISELEYRRVNRVTDVVKEGQEVRAKVLSVDLSKRRIALSLKALQARPESAPRKEDADLAPGGAVPYERKRKGPLKGGTTGGSGAGLFG